MKSIGNVINQNKSPESNVLPAKYVDDFFEHIPQKISHLWPLEFGGYKTEYSCAHKAFIQAGTVECLRVVATIANDKKQYIVANTFIKEDENLSIEMDSIYKQRGDSNSSEFITAYLQKMQFFLKAYDKTKPQSDYNAPSSISIFAKSKKTKNNVDCIGGYVWAKYNFIFKDKKELETAQNQLAVFAEEKNIKITNKQIKSLKKPSDFATFKSNSQNVGKEFLLKHSWRGIWNTNTDKEMGKNTFNLISKYLEKRNG